MDENEITTVADTQAENTADTADTGQTTPHHRGAYPAAHGEGGSS